ncbi:Zinc finger BED domain-containing protein 4 [Holothuria leucospilota]|uniref:Zinc finger BED domain-containing protein 4 n=1 Tax=Holothuria leucospilota TaxID=206669 RepID=A0A9Q1HDX4_HOLLE|nr:Zinc finger BED domain-containing protein 4 [Holothuria leucospilota]
MEGNADTDLQPWPGFKNYFQFKRQEDDKQKFQCKLCLPVVKLISASSSSPSNLTTHIKVSPSQTLGFDLTDAVKVSLCGMVFCFRVHPGQVESLNKDLKNCKRQKTSPISEKPLTQQDIRQFQKKSASVPQATVDRLVVDFIINDLQPFSLVEKPSFQNLIKGLQPERSVIGRKSVMRTIEENYQKMKTALINKMSNVTYVCTTADAWTARNRSYLGVTCHWIDAETLQRHSAAIACRRLKGSHTYKLLASTLEDIHKEFKIQNKVERTVTDNGSNFCKAFRLFGGQHVDIDTDSSEDDIPMDFTEVASFLDQAEESEVMYHLPHHHRCACHTLNLIASKDVEAAESDKTFKAVSRAAFGKCQAIFNKQSRSSLASDTVKEKLGRLLVVPNSTRWNSVYQALECITSLEEKQEGIFDALCDTLEMPSFRQTEMTFIKEFCEVMKPVCQALDILQGEKTASLGFLLPTITCLREKLHDKKISGNLRYCVSLVDALLAGISKRFGRLFQDNDYILASILHPRFKLSWIKCTEDKQKAVTLFKELVTSSQSEGSSDESEHRSSEEDNDEKGFFDSLATVGKTTSINEADRFIAQEPTSTASMLDQRFLKPLFIKYNTALPASAAVERLFSIGGQIFVPNRANISDANFERQLLLKVNKGLITYL